MLMLHCIKTHFTSHKDVPHAGVQWQDCARDPMTHQDLVDNHHRLVVSRLPVGVSPSKMRNKLTIYFQRKQNYGGEVLDVKYPAAQPDQAWVLFRERRGNGTLSLNHSSHIHYIVWLVMAGQVPTVFMEMFYITGDIVINWGHRLKEV